MRIDSTTLRPAVAETDRDFPIGAGERRPGVGTTMPVSESAAPEMVALPVSPPVPWMDPELGGRMALGTPERYLPALQSLYDELSRRDDPLARFGSAAILDELHNHSVLNGHLNSMIA